MLWIEIFTVMGLEHIKSLGESWLMNCTADVV